MGLMGAIGFVYSVMQKDNVSNHIKADHISFSIY